MKSRVERLDVVDGRERVPACGAVADTVALHLAPELLDGAIVMHERSGAAAGKHDNIGGAVARDRLDADAADGRELVGAASLGDLLLLLAVGHDACLCGSAKKIEQTTQENGNRREWSDISQRALCAAELSLQASR